MYRFVFLVGVLLPCTGWGMHIRTNVEILAFSQDGAAALLEKGEFGPEGGGALSYVLVSAKAAHRLEVTVSSDFSPGDGSRPQRVDVKTCQSALRRLGKVLAEAGVAGVVTHPERCSKRGRLVEVSPKKKEEVEASCFRGDADLRLGGLVLRATGTDLVLERDGAPTVVLNRAALRGKGKLGAVLSPSRRLLVVLRVTADETVAEHVFVSADGTLESLARIDDSPVP